MKGRFSLPPTTDMTRGLYRRIYGGFLYGQRINKLSMEAECWFWRLLVSVDDFGNMQASPTICCNLTVGNRTTIKPPQVAKWLQEMAAVNLISLYEVKGESFLHIEGFEETQPAGKNGKRYQRHPLTSMGESRIIQNNPENLDSGLASHSYNQDHTQDQEDNHTQARTAPELEPPFGGVEFLEALREYETHRKQKKSSLTTAARRALYPKLASWGESRATAALVHSTAQGWTGVFEPNGGGGSSGQSRVEKSIEAGQSWVAQKEAEIERARNGT